MVESPHQVDAYTIINHNLLASEGKIGCPIGGSVLIRLWLTLDLDVNGVVKMWDTLITNKAVHN